MPGMKLQSFKGMLPSIAPELLPDGYAQLARNVKLHSGDLIPYRAPMPVPASGSFTDAKTIYKVGAEWGRSGIDTDIVNISTGMGAPVRTYRANGKAVPLVDGFPLGLPIPKNAPNVAVGDVFTRHISYASRTDDIATIELAGHTGNPEPFKVGDIVNVYVDASGGTPTDETQARYDVERTLTAYNAEILTVSGDTITYFNPGTRLTRGLILSSPATVQFVIAVSRRTYIYTWLTGMGEESIPSEPSNAIRVREGQTVTVSGLPNQPPDGRDDIRGVRVYRLVTSAGGSSYLRLKTLWFGSNAPDGAIDPEFTVNNSPYMDDIPVSDLSLALPSIDYDAPPANLHGLREAHNNILVGFSDTELCFSLPNVPHAWPERHRLSLPSKITAVEPTQGAILVLTEDYPYIVSGNDPSTMTAIRLNTPYGCRHKRSVVVLDNGVMWVTDAGLALYQSGGGLRLATEASIAWDDWNDKWVGNTASAWYYEGKYLASTEHKNFIYDPGQQAGYFMELSNTFDAGYYDRDTGEFFFVYDGTLYQWDADPATNLEMEWTSKRFITPRFMNYGAAKLEANMFDCRVQGADTTPNNFTSIFTISLTCIGNTPNTGTGLLGGVITLRSDTKFTWDGEGGVSIDGFTPTQIIATRMPNDGANDAMTQKWLVKGAVFDFTKQGQIVITSAIGETNFTGSFEGTVSYVDATYKMNRGVPPSQCCDVIVSNNKPFRLPAGFKDDTYDITITGRSRVRSVHVAETVSGLRGV